LARRVPSYEVYHGSGLNLVKLVKFYTVQSTQKRRDLPPPRWQSHLWFRRYRASVESAKVPLAHFTGGTCQIYIKVLTERLNRLPK
jgi:hypothetical protein